MAEFLATLAAVSAAGSATAGTTAAATGLASAGAAAAGTAGSLGAAAALGATGGITASGVLSGAFTAFSALSTVGMGIAGFQQAKAQAHQAEIAAEQETIQGIQRANEITRQYLDTVSSQRVAYAASGIDLSSGTVGMVEQRTRELKDRQLAVNDGDTTLSRLAAKARKSASGKRANLALLDAGVRTAGIAFDG